MSDTRRICLNCSRKYEAPAISCPDCRSKRWELFILRVVRPVKTPLPGSSQDYLS